SCARLVQFAEYLVFSNHSGRGYTGGGFIFARVAPVRRLARGVAFRDHFFVDGCNLGDACLYFGKRTGHARLANLSDAPDLPANAQLLYLESDLARDQRCLGQLGQARTDSERSSTSMKQ